MTKSNKVNTPAPFKKGQGTPALNMELICDTASSIADLTAWVESQDDNETAARWARKIVNSKLAVFPVDIVRGYILPMVDEVIKERRIRDLTAAKFDDSEVSDLECQLLRDDSDHESMVAYFRGMENTADRAIQKDEQLEATTGKNRTSIDQRRYWHKATSEKILFLESLQDQLALGLTDREFVRQQLAAVYKDCEAKLKTVKWIRTTGSKYPIGYIKGCGYSVSNLRALANTALTILGEMGYRIPNGWWKRDSKGTVTCHEFTENNERQERDGEAWTNEIYVEFYNMIN